jgi:hypothetical protein
MMGFVRKRNENHVILAETPNLGFVGEKAKSFIKDITLIYIAEKGMIKEKTKPELGSLQICSDLF